MKEINEFLGLGFITYPASSLPPCSDQSKLSHSKSGNASSSCWKGCENFMAIIYHSHSGISWHTQLFYPNAILFVRNQHLLNSSSYCSHFSGTVSGYPLRSLLNVTMSVELNCFCWLPLLFPAQDYGKCSKAPSLEKNVFPFLCCISLEENENVIYAEYLLKF